MTPLLARDVEKGDALRRPGGRSSPTGSGRLISAAARAVKAPTHTALQATGQATHGDHSRPTTPSPTSLRMVSIACLLCARAPYPVGCSPMPSTRGTGTNSDGADPRGRSGAPRAGGEEHAHAPSPGSICRASRWVLLWLTTLCTDMGSRPRSLSCTGNIGPTRKPQPLPRWSLIEGRQKFLQDQIVIGRMLRLRQ